jgi:putative cell wall-binding protein
MEVSEQQERASKMTVTLPFHLNLDDRGAANILSTISMNNAGRKIVQSNSSNAESVLAKQAVTVTDSDSNDDNDDDKQQQQQQQQGIVLRVTKTMRRNRKIKHSIARHLLLLNKQYQRQQQQQRLLRLQEQERVAAFRRAAAMSIAKNIGGKTWEHAQLAATKHESITVRTKKY